MVDNEVDNAPKASARRGHYPLRVLIDSEETFDSDTGDEPAPTGHGHDGPNALPPDPAIEIRSFTSCPGAAGETLFVLKLGAAPEPGGPLYEYGVGLAIEGHPMSTPDPSAIAGFGRVALSRELFLEPDGEFLSLAPAARYAAVESGATALVVGVFVVFRVPDSELGAGIYYLQAFRPRRRHRGEPGGLHDGDGGTRLVGKAPRQLHHREHVLRRSDRGCPRA